MRWGGAGGGEATAPTAGALAACCVGRGVLTTGVCGSEPSELEGEEGASELVLTELKDGGGGAGGGGAGQCRKADSGSSQGAPKGLLAR
jgi:hypothetical protein